jgi:hypothetical protein
LKYYQYQSETVAVICNQGGPGTGSSGGNMEERLRRLRELAVEDKQRAVSESDRIRVAKEEFARKIAREDAEKWVLAIERKLQRKEYGHRIWVNSDSWDVENKKHVPKLDRNRLFDLNYDQLAIYCLELQRLLGPPFVAFSPSEGEYRSIIIDWGSSKEAG